jgi:hypothetical protein
LNHNYNISPKSLFASEKHHLWGKAKDFPYILVPLIL